MSMPEVPSAGQLALHLVTIAAVAIGAALSWLRLKSDRDGLRLSAKICLYAGILLGIGVLVWHSRGRRSWLPLGDNFDAMVWLALLLALFVAYTQRTKPLRGLDWFVLPMVVL